MLSAGALSPAERPLRTPRSSRAEVVSCNTTHPPRPLLLPRRSQCNCLVQQGECSITETLYVPPPIELASPDAAVPPPNGGALLPPSNTQLL